MGSHTFKWEQPADEVYVTGTFDNWTKSVKLEKQGTVFQKTVELQDASQKIYYKFVVDNTWTISDVDAKEPDSEGNVNNFLTPEQLLSTPAAAFINTVGPTSTTATMAGAVPKETQATPDPLATPSDVPGGFPETPANELDRSIGINPLPAAEGAVNPVKLEPGAKVPEAVAAQNINEHVKLDQESYEKSDTIPGVQSNMVIPPSEGKAIIPESGLPVTTAGDATISTVGAGATTLGLAGNVAFESKVPEVVKESQDKAGAAPEASAVLAEVEEKAKVEEELKEKVPEAPATSVGTSGFGTEKSENTGTIAATVATASSAVAAAAIAARDLFTEKATPAVTQATTTATDAANRNLPESVKEQLPVSAQETLASQGQEAKREEVSPVVPTEVKQSITEANESPEAAANTSAVEDKKAVEAELLKGISPAPATGETKGDEVKAVPTEGTQSLAAKPEAPATTITAPTTTAPTTTGATITAPTTTTATTSTPTTAAPNGSQSKPTASEASGSTKPADTSSTTTDRKKKNRLSSMFSKIKSKISDKN